MIIMIINDSKVKINLELGGVLHEMLSFEMVDRMLSPFKNQEILPKQMISIPNCYAYFSSDNENNCFVCKIYKTSFGTDIWIMLMKDEKEGYALYQNPESLEYEIAWYHSKLEEPLAPDEEKKLITCYVPE